MFDVFVFATIGKLFVGFFCFFFPPPGAAYAPVCASSIFVVTSFTLGAVTVFAHRKKRTTNSWRDTRERKARQKRKPRKTSNMTMKD